MKEPKVGVGVLIMRDGKALFGKRLGGYGKGTWSLPGGHLELNEIFEDAAKREVKEETGLIIDGIEVVSVSNDIMYGKHYITIGLKASKVKGEPITKEVDKFEKWDWFRLDQLPKPIFIASKNLVDSYLAKRIYLGNGK